MDGLTRRGFLRGLIGLALMPPLPQSGALAQATKSQPATIADDTEPVCVWWKGVLWVGCSSSDVLYFSNIQDPVQFYSPALSSLIEPIKHRRKRGKNQ